MKREEFDAVLEHFSLQAEAPRPDLASKYKFRRASAHGRARTVAITRCVEQGTGEAQTIANQAIKDLQPALILVVGIAGMPPSTDLFLGDVVLGTHVHDFNLAAETSRGQEFAEHGMSPPHWFTRYVCTLDLQTELADWYSPLANRPKIAASSLEFTSPNAEWNGRISACVNHHADRATPKVLDGPIASSDDLLKNPESLRKRLAVDRRIIAVEMESAGVARACNNVGKTEAPVPFLPIRGISDIVGLKRDYAWELYACQSAALFAARFVEHLPADFLANLPASASRSDDLASTLACLNDATKRALPSEVMRDALTGGVDGLARVLKEAQADGRIVEDGAGFAASKAVSPRTLPETATFLTPLLESLLSYIGAHAETEKGIGQVRAAVVLAQAILPQAPYLAAKVYDALDHPMKALGDKGLVRKVADICIAAASKRQHDRDAAECIARARICGYSWVYQRTNELELAQDEANKSLALGNKLNYTRNDAFCLKCLGRLLRMRAERSQKARDREKFLAESVTKLGDAIDLFRDLPDFGDAHPQVGDCYSLLGRTYLVGDNVANARKAASEAQRRITDEASKYFFDLQILLGDIAAWNGNNAAAIDHYSRAIPKDGASPFGDYDISEIVARALLQRGRALKATSKTAAKDDFEKAENIWEHLGEDYFAFEARWEIIKLGETIPAKTLAEIEKNSPEVRVKAYDFIQRRMQEKKASVVAQRKGHDGIVWTQALQKAREEIALDNYR
jgi:nucleoside phosphorylase